MTDSGKNFVNNFIELDKIVYEHPAIVACSERFAVDAFNLDEGEDRFVGHGVTSSSLCDALKFTQNASHVVESLGSNTSGPSTSVHWPLFRSDLSLCVFYLKWRARKDSNLRPPGS